MSWVKRWIFNNHARYLMKASHTYFVMILELS